MGRGKMARKSVIAGGASVFALALAVPSTSIAQGAETDDVITVTAQKRETTLQETPIAISAFSGELMEDRGIDDLSNLQSYVPNLHVGQEQDGFRVALRGVGTQGTTSLTDPGVAFYIDNLYMPRPTGGSAIFYDINRIEVLRGPQGTLYGRNATGGVINVISQEPEDEFGGKVGFTYGSRDLIEGRGVLNLPLGDVAAARFSIVRTEEGGYVENLSTQPGTSDLLGTDGDLTIRGQLLFEPSDDLKILLSSTYSDLDGTGAPLKYLERNTQGAAGGVIPLLNMLPPEDPDVLKVAHNSPTFNDTESLSAFARIEKGFGPVDAFLQVGGLWQDTNLLQDADGSDSEISNLGKQTDNEAFSVEFRLASNTEGPLEWLAGLYYFTEDTTISRQVTLRSFLPPPAPPMPVDLTPFVIDEFGDSSTIGGFASATYSLTDELRVTGGVRYTRDKKGGSNETISFFFGPPAPPVLPLEEKFDKVTWKGGLEYDAAENVLLYANVSTGYKAGGFNISGVSTDSYEPETLTAYEIGMKSSPLGGRAQVNIDAFYYDYTDLQLSATVPINDVPQQIITNAAATTVYGVELVTLYELTEALLFNFSYSYINAEFDEYCNRDDRFGDPGPGDISEGVCQSLDPAPPAVPLGLSDLNGNTLPFVSDHTITAGLQYTANLGGAGELVASVNTSWQSEYFAREYNDPVVDRQGSFSKTDVTVTYLPPKEGLSITGYVTNIENDPALNNIQVSPGFLGTNAVGTYTRPRSWGIRVDYEF